MEFIFLVGFLLFMFVIISGIIVAYTSDTFKKRDIIIGEDLVTKIQKEINLAARVLDGYSRKFMLPQKLGNRDYSILIVGNEVIVHTEKNDFWRVIPPSIGNLSKGDNIIRKTNGTIYIN